MKNSVRKVLFSAVCCAVMGSLSTIASAEPTYISGHISNVSFAGDQVLVMVDAGLPDNCVGTGWGWMRVAPEHKPMIAFVLGLWMRGDAAQTLVAVYTSGVSGGYCQITQIDPVG